MIDLSSAPLASPAAAASASPASARPSTGLDGGDGRVALRTAILDLLARAPGGLASKALCRRLGGGAASAAGSAASLADIGAVLTSLMMESRVEVLRVRRGEAGAASDLQTFHLVQPERAAKLAGLADEDQAVLGMVERSAATGIWVRSLKMNS